MSRQLILCLDAFLFILILLLLSPRLTEIPLHEWIGLLLIPVIFFHLLVSWRWISNVTKQFLSAAIRTKVNYLLNLTLFTLVVIASVSGILISRIAVPFWSEITINDAQWHTLHARSLLYLRFVVGFHIAMNWNWIVNSILRFTTKDGKRGVGTMQEIVLRLLVFMIASIVISIVLWLMLDAPVPLPEIFQDPFSRFSGEPARGFRQFLNSIIFLTVAAWLGRRLLRIKL